MSTLGRKEITAALTNAAVMHWVKLRYGVFTEIGLVRRGLLRADVLAINYRQHIVISETKSCLADYRADTKLLSYLGLCDQMYVLVPQALWDSRKMHEPAEGIGVQVLDSSTGFLRVVKKARVQDRMTEEERYDLITRMAFRSATFSKRNIARRKKVFLS